MTSRFRFRGFDTLIGKLTTIHGEMLIAVNTTALIEGNGFMSSVRGEQIDGKVSEKTTLQVAGLLQGAADGTPLDIEVQNVIITGKVVCKTIRVEGTLAIKAGATLTAETILYRELIIETGAVVHGQMSHLDYTSAGETI